MRSVKNADIAEFKSVTDPREAYEVRFALRRKLFALASGGMRDPEAMRTEILATLPL
jgi:hypothetical protein